MCEFTLKLVILALSTWCWCWYLVWELEHYSGRRKPKRWWEKEL